MMSQSLPSWRHCQFFLTLFCFSCYFSSYWSKFHVNIITCSGVMTIYFYIGLNRKPEIRDTPVWVLSNICRLGQVRDTKLGVDVPNKTLLKAAKCKGHSFYRFEVNKGKPTTEGKITHPPPPYTHTHTRRLGLSMVLLKRYNCSQTFLFSNNFSQLKVSIERLSNWVLVLHSPKLTVHIMGGGGYSVFKFSFA